MNWLDIVLIIVNVAILGFGIFCIVMAIKEKDSYLGEEKFIASMFWCLFLLFGWILYLPFIVIDKASGETMGKVTSVDKNFFGTTALFVKTYENELERYCIEDSKVVEEAKALIGKNVKISYGVRVRLQSTGKCHQAPVEKIVEVKEN